MIGKRNWNALSEYFEILLEWLKGTGDRVSGCSEEDKRKGEAEDTEVKLLFCNNDAADIFHGFCHLVQYIFDQFNCKTEGRRKGTVY